MVARRDRGRLVWVAAGTLALLGAAFAIAGVFAQHPAPPTLPAKRLVASESPPSTAQPLDHSPPVWITIPAIGVDAPVGMLGLREDRTLEVPSDPTKTGWYKNSAAPGATGPSVIVGHVTWNREPTVFFRLADVRPGDQVKVRRKDGHEVIYNVTEIAHHPKQHFPTERVYAATERPELRLVTCGGMYDQDSHNYDANIVVYGTVA